MKTNQTLTRTMGNFEVFQRLNVEFKYEVIKFVYDQLIQCRIEAGDTYREMAAEIAKISKKEDITYNGWQLTEVGDYEAQNFKFK